MQTLNVRAGRTDAEYKADEEQRRAELRADSRSDANLFFWAAGLAVLGTGLYPIRLNFLATIGAVDLLTYYGRSLGAHSSLVIGLALTWVVALVGLGFAARAGQRWAFLAGIIVYGADMVLLIVTFSIWSFGVHSFFVYKWFQGQRALRDLREANVPVS
jgi:hypothetical protein